MRPGVEIFHPEGMIENSPAFQRWDHDRLVLSPEGTAEPVVSQPSLRDLWLPTPAPSVETLGYFLLSLRDEDAAQTAQALVELDDYDYPGDSIHTLFPLNGVGLRP